jgi:putative aldouronate transport system permease protein
MLNTRGERLFGVSVNLFLVIVLLIVAVPLWYVLMVSLTPLDQAGRLGYRLLMPPNEWSFEAYRQLLTQPLFAQATLNSLWLLAMGVPMNVVLTVLMAYPLSRKALPGRGIFIGLALLVFLFNVGFIPTYLLVRDLHLIDSFAAVILPGAISVYNLFVMKAFFQAIPESLEEAARIDGANDWQILWMIVLPLSRPVLLTIGLFYALANWNEFFSPLLFLNSSDKMPLPVLLYNIIRASSMSEMVESSAATFHTTHESLKMAAVVLTTLPMVLVYPWIQRYFTHGVLLGSIKE